MGIIKRQSITGTVYLYLGVVLGFITTGILFPIVFTTEQVGLLRLLLSVAILISQFASLGFYSPTIRLFPYFRDKEKGHNGFLCLSLLISLAGYIFFIAALVILKPWIVAAYQDKSALFVDYFYYLIPLIFFTLLFNTLETYYKVLYNAVKGTLLKDVWQRIFILICVTSYFLELIDFDMLVRLYVISIGLPPILLIIALIKEGQFNLKWGNKFITKSLAKNIINMSMYGIISGFSGILIVNIDLLMINHFLGLSFTGIYAITMYFGTLANIPARSIRNISTIVISDAWKSENISTINDIYRRSSLILTVIGSLIICGLWANIDNVFKIIGPEYEAGRYVILFIGIANLFDMATGVGKNIIHTSPYYRYLTWFIVLFFVIIVVTNLILIPAWGIIGAAIASAVSKLIYNILIWAFLWTKFNFQPFNYKYLLIVAITVGTYLLSTSLNTISPMYLDLTIRSLMVTVTYLAIIYFLRISPDINNTIKTIIYKS